jgi:MFS family permease
MLLEYDLRITIFSSSKRPWTSLTYLKNPTGAEMIPMIASSYTLAAIVMSCLVVMVGMPLGRRNSIVLGNVLVFIGGAIQAASFSVPQIIIARVICVRISLLGSSSYCGNDANIVFRDLVSA